MSLSIISVLQATFVKRKSIYSRKSCFEMCAVRALPHQREADLKGGRIVLEGDDEVEDERRDEVGQRDDDGGQILHHQLQQEGTLLLLNTQPSVET